MNCPIGMFTTDTQRPVPLCGVDVEARLRDLFCDVSLSQTYENSEGAAVEVVYAFPLPLEAVLLDVAVTLGERKLSGSVVPRYQAEQRYEAAIVSGDAAVRLEQVEPGLYAMNLGNLLPGERAVIKVRYGQLLRWNGDSVRFHLPTTVAPRYGEPAMRSHLVPSVSLTVDHHYSFTMRVEGLLSGAALSSPTHSIQYAHTGGGVEVSLARGPEFMDRDFVLNLSLPQGTRSSAVAVADGAHRVALLSWRPSLPAQAELPPRAVKIVVDCSGSMNGDSITQARVALLRIVESLRPQDSFDIVRFGNTAHALFGRLARATGTAREQALDLASALRADLGGTEIAAALQTAYSIGGAEREACADILLITDGQVHDMRPIVGAARASRHRVFTVGVGASVAEAFVRELAEATGGACELVTPNEEMAERIVRHFQRMHRVGATNATITWPGNPIRQVPAALQAVFDGDTIHAFAWLPLSTDGDVRMAIALADGRTVTETAPLQPLADRAADHAATHPVARLAARAWLESSPVDAESIALRYQLITDRTDFIVVHERAEAEKAQGLPGLRSVPHMLAAGWGGTGTVVSDVFGDVADLSAPLGPSALAEERLDWMPVASRAAPTSVARRIEPDHAQWVERAAELIELDPALRGLALLAAAGAPAFAVKAVERLVLQSVDEHLAGLLVLREMADMFGLPREIQRVIGKALYAARPTPEQMAEARAVLSEAHAGS